MSKETIEILITAFQIILVIIGCLMITKIILHYILFYFEFMFNKKSTWNGEIEKPRLAILTILIPSLLALYTFMANTNKDSVLALCYQTVTALIILITFYFIYFKLMNHKKITKISKNIGDEIEKIQKGRTKSQFTGISIKEDLSKIDIIYDHLIDNDLINFEKTEKEDFRNVMTRTTSDSIIYLTMDNPTARDFFIFLKEVFIELRDDTQTSFFENYKKVFRFKSTEEDPKPYNSKQMSNSKQRTQESKYYHLFKVILKELNYKA